MTDEHAVSRPAAATVGDRVRWQVCLLLFFATTINYADRQVLALLKPLLDHELGWTKEQFGYVNAGFQGAYAVSYLLFGVLIDRVGTKAGLSVSVAAWSLFAAAHALAGSVAGFFVARVALGLGEGGNFPAAIKTVSEWFPPRERPLATALFNSGANVGALVAPAVVPPLAAAVGWQGTFVVAGAAGFVWLAFWLALYRAPPETPGGPPVAAPAADGPAIILPFAAAEALPLTWGRLLSYRQTWAYLVAKLLTDPVWWFFLIWLPDYFKTDRGLDLKAMGLPLVAIYTIVTVLSVAGSWAAKRLAETGWSINATRKVTLLIFACCVLPIVVATRADLWGAVALIGLAGAAHQAWSATLFSTVADVFPRRAVASVVGLGGLVGGLGGMVFPVVCGRYLDHTPAGYSVLFGYCGGAYLLAFVVNSALCPRFEPVRPAPADAFDP